MNFFALSLSLLSITSSALGYQAGMKDGFLNTHNRARGEHGVGGMYWDNNLAAGAQLWANRCQFAHSRGNYGENLAMGHRTASLAVQEWVNERSSYNYNYGDFSAATGHFTQVVWKGSTRLGCGARLCGRQWLYVCRYQSPGNFRGRFQANVFPRRGGAVYRRTNGTETVEYEHTEEEHADADGEWEDETAWVADEE
ncbi:CAP domain-containing protein [Pyronema domesticum]|uniref:Similar to Protein PRY2 acc. no. P36110 n=1 Tax=Pyronema omphalodes (strain CBS 100304) TaxID=1076935 RepID=U4L4T3_PYROM|nr:CAP domain-containing protein [Pyronema domesticum]CCX05055.1 Similar to Protein PRY2; acc. no. P36110 [Pyronema omphalodes CBS 100304]